MNYSWKNLIVHARQSLELIYDNNEANSIARRLVEVHSGLTFLQIVTNESANVSQDNAKLFFADLARLQLYEPLQYVIGKTEFMNLEIKLNHHVLIPRPETEQMLAQIFAQKDFFPNRIADFCSGSGCIALALKQNFGQESRVFGFDISMDALAIAEQNAAINKLEVEWKCADLLNLQDNDKLPKNLDLIVSNPPYIPILEKVNMANNVIEYEPAIALFVEDNEPIIFYQSIGKIAIQNLLSGGQLWFEVHQDFGFAVSDYLRKIGFGRVEIYNDFNEKIRFVKAIKD